MRQGHCGVIVEPVAGNMNLVAPDPNSRTMRAVQMAQCLFWMK
jgi:glutamate-1-semialdehyde aminotransferase